VNETRSLVLVADDDPDILMLVRVQPRRIRLRRRRSEDGDQALPTALERTPDLALLDVMMPRLNGYELTERLRGEKATRTCRSFS
jgi:CheY-like chemotaxis protein